MSEQATDTQLSHLREKAEAHFDFMADEVLPLIEELRLWRTLGRISEKDGHPDIEIEQDEDGNYSCPICGEHLGSEEDISFEGYLRTAGIPLPYTFQIGDKKFYADESGTVPYDPAKHGPKPSDGS